MKISIKGFITSKESELFSDCADRYAVNTVHNKFAISDGVSKSFFPKFWAELLVDNFVKSKELDENKFLEDCQEGWLKKVSEIVKKPNVKWFTTNAFNNKKPGLATFVGLEFFNDKKGILWRANALGDSFLFYAPQKIKDFEKDIFKLSSKTDLVFDNFPDYFSSIGNKHKGKVKACPPKKLKAGTFYLMTDALSEWFINEKKDALDEIENWKNQDDFEEFVARERRSTKLGNDDSAILIINLVEDNENKISYSENKHSDIYDLASKQEHKIKKQAEELEEKKKQEEEELKNQVKETPDKEIQESINSAEENSVDNSIESTKPIKTEEAKLKNKVNEEVENSVSENLKIETISEESDKKEETSKKGIVSSLKKGFESVTNFVDELIEPKSVNEPLEEEKEKPLPKEKEKSAQNKGSESESKPVTETKKEKQKSIEPTKTPSPKGGKPNKSNITDKF